MTIASSALDAAIRALRGESDMNVVNPALDNTDLARIIALAPGANRAIRGIAALLSDMPALLDPPTIADPAFHDAVARMIGTAEGRSALSYMRVVAPAGWGRPHAAALSDAAKKGRCNAGVAAALIGPCDESAALLRNAYDVAFAIRRWGQSTPDTPTAWMHALSAEERDRLLAIVHHDRRALASCLPWLSPERANELPSDEPFIGAALSAFAEASPATRTLYADLLQRLIAQAQSWHLSSLTRLACVMESDEVWRRIVTLVQESPDDVYRVVAATPWDNLDATARTVILECADRSDICAVVAAARGQEMVERITDKSAATFFAALDPQVWDALPSNKQRRWRDALLAKDAHLAVRVLGPRPEVLVKAELDNNLVTSARRHTSNVAEMRWALLPVALRNLRTDAASQLIAALPTPPPDPGAFFVIAGKHVDPSVIVPAQERLRTPADLACAVALQRCTDPNLSIRASCATLRDMLCGRSWDDLAPIIALLSDDARATLIPDRDALVERLAHPDRKDALRQALARLETLPPEVAVPTFFALDRRTRCAWNASDAAGVIADALRAHGEVFMAMGDALADRDLRTEMLPLPTNEALAHALRALADEDPLSAHRLAHALRHRGWRDAIHALLTAPRPHAEPIWRALPPSTRSAIDKTKTTEIAAADGRLLSMVTRHDPLASCALAAALQADDADLRRAGIAALAARPDVLRALWAHIPQETQQSWRADPSILVAVADIPAEQADQPARIRRSR